MLLQNNSGDAASKAAPPNSIHPQTSGLSRRSDGGRQILGTTRGGRHSDPDRNQPDFNPAIRRCGVGLRNCGTANLGIVLLQLEFGAAKDSEQKVPLPIELPQFF